MEESRHKSKPNPPKGMALEVYKYKVLKHTKGSTISTFKVESYTLRQTSAQIFEDYYAAKALFEECTNKAEAFYRPKQKHSLKNQQALVPIPSRLCCKLKTCNDVRFKIKSPRPLNQRSPTSTSSLPQP